MNLMSSFSLRTRLLCAGIALSALPLAVISIIVLRQNARMTAIAIEQEVDEGGFPVFGDVGKCLLELNRIRSIVGRQALPDDQDAGVFLLRGIGQGCQVVTHRLDRQAAQAVVGAERNDDDVRPVLVQRRTEPRPPAARGFARDAGVGDAIIKSFLFEAFCEQARPGRFLSDAIAG